MKNREDTREIAMPGQGDLFRGYPEEPTVFRKVGARPVLASPGDGSGTSEWIPRYERMIVAGKQVRLSVFERPYYTGGHRESRGRLLGRASQECTEEEKEENRKRNAKRREQKAGDLIRCNVKVWKKSEETVFCNKFVTLTVKDDIRDISDATPLLKPFFAKITRIARKEDLDFRLKHLWVTEFQDESRGVVHFHILCNLPYIKQRPVITRERKEGGGEIYEYLCKDGSWSKVVDRRTRVFESFYHAKKHMRAIDVRSLFGYKVRIKRVLYDLARAWGQGFVDIEIVKSQKKAKAYITKLINYLSKAGNDPRFVEKRAFDYSRGTLEKPLVVVSSHKIASFIEEEELWLALESESYFESYLGETQLYIFDMYYLVDTTFNPPPEPPSQKDMEF